jgi:hypothetical protein
MFAQRNIYKYTWTFLDGKPHNQIDHVLLGRRWYSSILEVPSFMGATVMLITIRWLQMLGKDWQ